MGGYKIAGLNTSLPPRHTDAICLVAAIAIVRK